MAKQPEGRALALAAFRCQPQQLPSLQSCLLGAAPESRVSPSVPPALRGRDPARREPSMALRGARSVHMCVSSQTAGGSSFPVLGGSTCWLSDSWWGWSGHRPRGDSAQAKHLQRSLTLLCAGRTPLSIEGRGRPHSSWGVSWLGARKSGSKAPDRGCDHEGPWRLLGL